MTTLIGLDGDPGLELVGRLAAAFEQQAGSDATGLREGFHARLKGRLRRYGGLKLPPLAEKRGGEMTTLLCEFGLADA